MLERKVGESWVDYKARLVKAREEEIPQDEARAREEQEARNEAIELNAINDKIEAIKREIAEPMEELKKEVIAVKPNLNLRAKANEIRAKFRANLKAEEKRVTKAIAWSLTKAEESRLRAERNAIAKAKAEAIAKAKAEARAKVMEAIDYLVSVGADRDELIRLYNDDKLGLATIEEAKRNAYKFDGVILEAGVESLYNAVKDASRDEVEDALRTYVRANLNKFEEAELIAKTKEVFGKRFKLSYSKFKKTGKTYLRVLTNERFNFN